ncbi:MAG: tyrosine-type recombinase/integrase [Planctomycetes bacterium]|nr:tyrosine-type recombinase/integrase [Planctomycetota bacterium]
MADSTRRRSGSKVTRKLKKPRRADFPLNIHQGTGYWCKKVLGKVHYFGKVVDDPEGIAALEEWLRVRDYLKTGSEPPTVDPDSLTVEELCFRFLEYKESERDNSELSPRTYQTYLSACKTVAEFFGRQRAVASLAPVDFRKLRDKLKRGRGLVALGNEIGRIKAIFHHAYKDGLLPHPIQFGVAFTRPKREKVDAAREAHRQEHGPKMFEASEIRAIIAAAKQPLKAMILLAANTGFGNTDLSSLPMRAVDLDKGWVEFARVKTAVRRRIPLWPETVQAIREWLPKRPSPKDKADANLLFLTCRGQRWVKITKSGAPADALGQEFCKVVAKLGLKRSRLGLYGLRHTFETIAGETTDQIVVDAIMGHKVKGMAGHYIERIGDDRRLAVVEHVRQWLFSDTDTDDGAKETPEICSPPQQEEKESGENDRPSLKLFAG